MKVALDLDGVIYPFHNTFKRFCEIRLNKELSLGNNFETAWEMSREDIDHLYEEFVEADGLRAFLPINFGIMKALRSHEIYIVTSRGHIGSESVIQKARTDTLIWLDRYKISYHGILFIREKHLFCANLMIEDDAKFFEKFEGKIIYVKHDWNNGTQVIPKEKQTIATVSSEQEIIRAINLLEDRHDS